MGLFKSKKKQDVNVAICVVTPLDHKIDVRLCAWLMKTQERIQSTFIFAASRAAEDGRNSMLTELLKSGSRYTHIFFCDADTVPPDYALDRLLNLNKPAVAGVTPIFLSNVGLKKWSAAIEDKKGHKILIDKDKLPDKPFMADAVGGTTLLVKKEIIDKIGSTWFYTKRDRYGKITLSEDFFFCDLIRAKGYEIWVDPSVKCSHLNNVDIGAIW